jgi:anti-sigma factor RsiW
MTMTCRKARRLLALFAGDDLAPRRARAVQAHLEACPDCRRELEALRAALAEAKAEAGREAVPEWGAGEWRALMARVAGEARDGRSAERGPGGRLPRPRGAAAAALGALAGLAALALLVLRPPSGPEGTERADRAAGEQDVVSLTMVSHETGLQVVWFFDKNFDYKGERE